MAYFKKGDLDRSLKDYTAAITIFQAPEYYASRGHVYEINGDKLKAIDDLRHALLADPSLVAVRDALKRLGAEQPIAIETERRIRNGMALAEANVRTATLPERPALVRTRMHRNFEIFIADMQCSHCGYQLHRG